MCGIVGVVSEGAKTFRLALSAMLKLQGHRGPDESGMFEAEGCLLGHNRLSIVDLASGQQPMTTNDGRYTIVFNGEIYGFKDIKSQLNYRFNTNSDTEVILALYIEYGKDMLQKLPGMFAFAIWDDEKKELFFARDRVGEKPFYYGITQHSDFIFASEVKTLASSGMIDLELSPNSIGHLLNKLYIHPNHSIYKNINALPAGHYGKFSAGQLCIEQYWRPKEVARNISYFEAVEELEYLFRKSIKEQLIADVPVSVFLSGGLDSSTVAAYAHHENKNIEALSFRFKSGLDEGVYAQAVGNMHGIKVTELYEDENLNVLKWFKKSIECYGEPFADSSAIPTMMICEAASRHSKVVLSGDGADELFGGYVNRYRPTIYLEKMLGRSKLRLLAAKFIFGGLNKVLRRPALYARTFAAKNALNSYSIPQSLDLGGIFKDDELHAIGLIRQKAIYPKHSNGVNSGMMFDIKNYLPGDILVKVDRAAMAAGLEVRAPFLSKEILEFAITLPSVFKITSGQDKLIMRDTFQKSWPEAIKNRPKQGFGSPVERWLKEESMIGFKRSMFAANSKIHSYVSAEMIKECESKSTMRTWALLTLASWLEFKYK